MAGLRFSVVVTLLTVCLIGQAFAEWSSWDDWEECDCYEHTQKRYRDCYGDSSNCYGSRYEERECEYYDCGLSNGAIAGIVVGCVVGVFLIIICIVLCCWGGCCFCCGGMRRWDSDSSIGPRKTVIVQPPPQPQPMPQPMAMPQVVVPQVMPQVMAPNFATAVPQVRSVAACSVIAPQQPQIVYA